MRKYEVLTPEYVSLELGLNRDIYDQAVALHQKYFFTNNIKRPSLSKFAGCLYFLAKKDPLCVPLPLSDFATKTHSNRFDIAWAYRKLMLVMDDMPQRCTLRPNIYVDTVLKQTHAPVPVQQMAIKVLETLNSCRINPLEGNNPVVVAAAIVQYSFDVCGHSYAEKEMTHIGKCSSISVGDSYRVITMLMQNGENGVSYKRRPKSYPKVII